MAEHSGGGGWEPIVTPWHLDEYIPAFPIPASATETIRPALPAGPVPARMSRLHQAVAGAVARAARPLLLSGDCPTARAAVAGLQRCHRDLAVVWLDAHGDFNTPATAAHRAPQGHAGCPAHQAGQPARRPAGDRGPAVGRMPGDDSPFQADREICRHARLCPANGGKLLQWIGDARTADLTHLHSFTRGLEIDISAATAALQHHNGRTEGVNNKTKMIKRQTFGRAGFELLRHRIFLG